MGIIIFNDANKKYLLDTIVHSDIYLCNSRLQVAFRSQLVRQRKHSSRDHTEMNEQNKS